MLALVNAERQSNGLPPLEMDDRLSSVARAHSIDMAQRGYFDHTDPDGQSPFDRIGAAGIAYFAAGENIAWGAATPESVVKGWMDSPGHRANILNEKFTRIGIGYYDLYWTQVFIG